MIDKKSFLMGFLFPVALIFLMGAAGVLSRYHTIEAQKISLVDENGNVITTLSELNDLIEKVESLDGLVDKKIKDIKQAVNDAFEVEFRVAIDTLSHGFQKLNAQVDTTNQDFTMIIDDVLTDIYRFEEFVSGNEQKHERLQDYLESLDSQFKSFKRSTSRGMNEFKFSTSRIGDKLESLDEMENKIDILMNLKSLQKEIKRYRDGSN